MKYIQVINNKIVGTPVTGLKPYIGNWLEVIIETKPTEYPSDFYTNTISPYRHSIVAGKVHESYGFVLKSVESIQSEIYQSQKEERQVKQLGSFMVGELEVTLKDREDSLIISSLAEADTRYKIGQGQWITLTATDVAALKEAHRLHVQSAYDWEMGVNEEVSLLTTLPQLRDYLSTEEEQ